MVLQFATMPTRSFTESDQGASRSQQIERYDGHDDAQYQSASAAYGRKTAADYHQQAEDQASLGRVAPSEAVSVANDETQTVLTSNSETITAQSGGLSLLAPIAPFTASTARGINTTSALYAYGSYNMPQYSIAQQNYAMPAFRSRQSSDVKMEPAHSSGDEQRSFYAQTFPPHFQKEMQPTSQQQAYAYTQPRRSNAAEGPFKAHQHIDTEAFASVDHAAATNLAMAASKPIARKGRWSPAEDHRLRDSVAIHGPSNWKQVAKDVGTRTGDQCWKRWNDALRPDLVHSTFTPAEDEILETAVHDTHGRSWSKIAKELLHGRCGLACKNRFDHIERKRRRKQVSIKHGASASMSIIESTSRLTESGTADEASLAKTNVFGMSAHRHATTGPIRHHRSVASLSYRSQTTSSSTGSKEQTYGYGSSQLSADSIDKARHYGRHLDSGFNSSQSRQQRRPYPFSFGAFPVPNLIDYRWPTSASLSYHRDDASLLQQNRAEHFASNDSRHEQGNSQSHSGTTTRAFGNVSSGSTGNTFAWSGLSSGGQISGQASVQDRSHAHPSLQQGASTFPSSCSSASSPTDVRSGSIHSIYNTMNSDICAASSTDNLGNCKLGSGSSMCGEGQNVIEEAAYYAQHNQPSQDLRKETNLEADSMQSIPTRTSESTIASQSTTRGTHTASVLAHADTHNAFATREENEGTLCLASQQDVRGNFSNTSGTDFSTAPAQGSVPQAGPASRSYTTGLAITSLPYTSYTAAAYSSYEAQDGRYKTSSAAWPEKFYTEGHRAATNPSMSEASLSNPAYVPNSFSAMTESYSLQAQNRADAPMSAHAPAHFSLQSQMLQPRPFEATAEVQTSEASQEDAYGLPHGPSTTQDRINDSGLAPSSASMLVPFDGGGSEDARRSIERSDERHEELYVSLSNPVTKQEQGQEAVRYSGPWSHDQATDLNDSNDSKEEDELGEQSTLRSDHGEDRDNELDTPVPGRTGSDMHKSVFGHADMEKQDNDGEAVKQHRQHMEAVAALAARGKKNGEQAASSHTRLDIQEPPQSLDDTLTEHHVHSPRRSCGDSIDVSIRSDAQSSASGSSEHHQMKTERFA